MTMNTALKIDNVFQMFYLYFLNTTKNRKRKGKLLLKNEEISGQKTHARINLPLFSTVLPPNSCCFCPVGLSLLIQHFQHPQDLLKMY